MPEKNEPIRVPLWRTEQIRARQMHLYNFCCFKLFPLVCDVPTVQIKTSIFWVTVLYAVHSVPGKGTSAGKSMTGTQEVAANIQMKEQDDIAPGK